VEETKSSKKKGKAAVKAEVSATALSKEVVNAVRMGDVAAVTAWLDGGGQVNALYDPPDGSGCGSTMLMAACGHGHTQLVDVLLERGASVNHQSSHGDTALIIAAYHGHAAVVRRMCAAGADTFVRGMTGCTAASMAKQNGHTACLEALEEHVRASAAERKTADGTETAAGEVSGVNSGSARQTKVVVNFEKLLFAMQNGDLFLVRAWLQAAAGKAVDLLNTNPALLNRAVFGNHADMVRCPNAMSGGYSRIVTTRSRSLVPNDHTHTGRAAARSPC
jgi:hypothetical protein